MRISEQLNERDYNMTKFGVDVLRFAVTSALGFATGYGILAAWGVKLASLVVTGAVSTHVAAVPNLLYPKLEAKLANSKEQASLLPTYHQATRCEKANKHLHGFLSIAGGMAIAGAAATFGAPEEAVIATGAAAAGFFSTVVSRGQTDGSKQTKEASPSLSLNVTTTL